MGALGVLPLGGKSAAAGEEPPSMVPCPHMALPAHVDLRQGQKGAVIPHFLSAWNKPTVSQFPSL